MGESAGHMGIKLVKRRDDLTHTLWGQRVISRDADCRVSRSGCRLLFQNGGPRRLSGVRRSSTGGRTRSRILRRCHLQWRTLRPVGTFLSSAATGLTWHISAGHRFPPEQWWFMVTKPLACGSPPSLKVTPLRLTAWRRDEYSEN